MTTQTIPVELQRLRELAEDPGSSIDAFRAAAHAADPKPLTAHFEQLVAAMPLQDEVSDRQIKILCMHEAIAFNTRGTKPANPIGMEFIDPIVTNPKGTERRYTDDEASKVIGFMLDNGIMKPFKGLLYKVSCQGWRETAAMIYAREDRGGYKPMAWPLNKGSANGQELINLATVLLDTVKPSFDDLHVLRKSFTEGSVAMGVVDRALLASGTPLLDKLTGALSNDHNTDFVRNPIVCVLTSDDPQPALDFLLNAQAHVNELNDPVVSKALLDLQTRILGEHLCATLSPTKPGWDRDTVDALIGLPGGAGFSQWEAHLSATFQVDADPSRRPVSRGSLSAAPFLLENAILAHCAPVIELFKQAYKDNDQLPLPMMGRMVELQAVHPTQWNDHRATTTLDALQALGCRLDAMESEPFIKSDPGETSGGVLHRLAWTLSLEHFQRKLPMLLAYGFDDQLKNKHGSTPDAYFSEAADEDYTGPGQEFDAQAQAWHNICRSHRARESLTALLNSHPTLSL